jgi:hypothetical protein
MDKDSLEIIKEIAKANAEALYKDAAKPSIRVVGKSLAQCVSLFSRPVGRMAEIFEKNIHRYLDKLEGINEEDLVEPHTRILVPILEKMRFTDEEEVAEYYAQILATASKKEHSNKVMVTFIEILNRLSADEIKILEYIISPSNQVSIPELTEDEVSKYNITKDAKILNLSGSLPVIDIKRETKGKTGYSLIKKNFNCLSEKVGLDNPDNIDFYLDNLISLGLIEKKHQFRFAIEKIYSHLENHSEILKIKESVAKEEPTVDISFVQGRVDITDLGNKLLSLCSVNK